MKYEGDSGSESSEGSLEQVLTWVICLGEVGWRTYIIIRIIAIAPWSSTHILRSCFMHRSTVGSTCDLNLQNRLCDFEWLCQEHTRVFPERLIYQAFKDVHSGR